MSKVAIVDYGMCNLDSIARAVEECGGNPQVTSDPRDLANASRIVLPGVGAFPEAMSNLKERSLDQALLEQASGKHIPLLGICLGMQLLAAVGRELEVVNGLGLIPGEVRRLQPNGEDMRIPHIGWNEVMLVRESALFHGIPAGKDFYFVHSFHLCCDDEPDVLAWTPYCGRFVSAVQRDLVFGVQFHPEKSQQMGFQLLKNFLSI